jgi:hypothetical protein
LAYRLRWYEDVTPARRDGYEGSKVFVHDAITLDQPYARVRRRLLDDPAWIAPIATASITQTLVGAGPGMIAVPDPADLTMPPEAVRCQLAAARLTTGQVVIPLRWITELDREVFPAILDADLRVTDHEPRTTTLELMGTYASPTPAMRDSVHDLTSTAVAVFLRDLAATFPTIIQQRTVES